MSVFCVIMPNRFGGRDMLEVYVIVGRPKSWVLKFLSYICVIIGVCITYMAMKYIGLFLFMPIALVFYILGWFLYRREIEFEYSYFDGDFRFAKIINKQKRKELPSYAAENVLWIAPKGDRSLYQYENGGQIKVRDYSSGNPEAKVYGMVAKKQDAYQLIWFEPDQEYLDAVCIKYGQKVVK